MENRENDTKRADKGIEGKAEGDRPRAICRKKESKWWRSGQQEAKGRARGGQMESSRWRKGEQEAKSVRKIKREREIKKSE